MFAALLHIKLQIICCEYDAIRYGDCHHSTLLRLIRD